jgi:hypothetical protein
MDAYIHINWLDNARPIEYKIANPLETRQVVSYRLEPTQFFHIRRLGVLRIDAMRMSSNALYYDCSYVGINRIGDLYDEEYFDEEEDSPWW